jgi:hypothetical protein
MIIEPLFEGELSEQYTHIVEITFADIAALATGATGNLAIASLKAGDVFGNVTLWLDTAFVFSDASVVSFAATVGDSTSATADLASTELASAGTTVLGKAGTSKVIQLATNTKNIYFTGTSAHNINTATAGKVILAYTKVSFTAAARGF